MASRARDQRTRRHLLSSVGSALQPGKHVALQPPLNISVEECYSIVKGFVRRGRFLTDGFKASVRFFVEAQMAAFPLVRLLPTLLLLGLLGQLLEVEADAVADAASSQVNIILGLPCLSICHKTKVKINIQQSVSSPTLKPKILDSGTSHIAEKSKRPLSRQSSRGIAHTPLYR